MTITYQVESWDHYYRDPAREGLWLEHYAEFAPAHEGKMEMAPDLQVFRAMQTSGALQVMVARRAGKMIGYCLVVVRPHIHYCRTLCAFEDSYFVTKSERKGFTGIRLIANSIRALRARGVRRVYFMTKEFNSIALVLERMGMTKIDSVYAMWLEN